MNAAAERGLAEHIRRRRDAIAGGRQRLGWKVAFNAPAMQERLGLDGSLVAGLTTATLLPRGGEHSLAGGTRIILEAEVAVRLGTTIEPGADDAAVAAAVEAWAPAIEVADMNRPVAEELEAVIAEGIFHRAVAFGEWVRPSAGLTLNGTLASVTYGGEPVAEVDAEATTGRVVDVLRHVVQVLDGIGERLEAGDVVILGAMAVAPAKAGAEFVHALGGIGTVSLRTVD